MEAALSGCAPVRARSILEQDLRSQEGRPRQVLIDAEVESVESMLLIHNEPFGRFRHLLRLP
jgi:hypothetical protein